MRNLRRMFGPALLIAGVIALVAPTALAQRGQGPVGGQSAARGSEEAQGKAKGVSQKQRENVEARIAAATAIADRLAADAKARGLASGWRQATLETLLPLSLEALQRVEQQAYSLDAVASATKAAAEDPNLLGDPNADLVYTPIAPCRFVNTIDYAGGKINGIRGFDFALSGANYGGAGGCHLPTLFGVGENSFGAVAMNVTVVDTSIAGSPGFLAAKPNAAAGVTSLINWFTSSVNVQVANAGIVSTDQTGTGNEFVIQTSGAVHVIVDIFGAFIEPEATAVDNQVLTTQTLITGSVAYDVFSPPCPAGWRVTGGGFVNTSYTDPPPISSRPAGGASISLVNGVNTADRWLCQGTSDASTNVTCQVVCSRTPGR